MNRKSVAELLASHEHLTASSKAQSEEIAELRRQLEWFKKQLFGSKSERRLVDPDGRQLSLGEWRQEGSPGQEITVAEHRRRSSTRRDEKPEADEVRFDDSVPVEEIRIENPALDDEHEVVSEKVTYRLAQKPASYVLLKYIRPVVKRKSDGELVCPPAPASVLGKSIADVSLLACLAIDKFLYHLPLYRQHQRMAAAGIRLNRSTLTGLVHRTGDLLQPIYEAQWVSVLAGDVVAMDETPIKAGRKVRGKMNTGYFWPIYGDRGEIVFPFSDSRSGEMLQEALDGYEGVLLTDGYEPYVRYAARVNEIVHAQCWSHYPECGVIRSRLLRPLWGRSHTVRRLGIIQVIRRGSRTCSRHGDSRWQLSAFGRTSFERSPDLARKRCWAEYGCRLLQMGSTLPARLPSTRLPRGGQSHVALCPSFRVEVRQGSWNRSVWRSMRRTKRVARVVVGSGGVRHPGSSMASTCDPTSSFVASSTVFH